MLSWYLLKQFARANFELARVVFDMNRATLVRCQRSTMQFRPTSFSLIAAEAWVVSCEFSSSAAEWNNSFHALLPRTWLHRQFDGKLESFFVDHSAKFLSISLCTSAGCLLRFPFFGGVTSAIQSKVLLIFYVTRDNILIDQTTQTCTVTLTEMRAYFNSHYVRTFSGRCWVVRCKRRPSVCCLLHGGHIC